MSYDPSQVAFIDTKTTGLDPERHRIWEYAVIVNGAEHVWQSRLGEGAVAARRFADLTRGRHLVGACPWFDSERAHRALLRLDVRDLPWHYHLIDVETLMVGFLQGNSWTDSSERQHLALPWDSRELSRAFGVNPDDYEAHTALGDARWAKACFEAIMGGPVR